MRRLFSTIVLLLFSGAGCDTLSDTTEEAEIGTPDGPEMVKRQTVEASPQQITVLDDDHVVHLQSLSEPGPQFVATFLPDVQSPGLKEYDEAFRLWLGSIDSVYSAQQVVEILGSYLGQRCVADLNMEWVQVSDEFGTDYAVRGKYAEVIVYPFSTVMKRVQSKEHGFLHNVYYAIQDMLESGEYPKDPTEASN